MNSRALGCNILWSELPWNVRSTVDFFNRRKLWHLLTRNSVATSCADAAARRYRLGRLGIALYDELRSFCGAAYLADGSRRAVLCHCRANAHFDLEAVAQLLSVSQPIVRLPADEMSENHAGYGTINPFSEPSRYLQVFDEDILVRYTAPHTMMTNAGEQTWAVEFKPLDVINALQRESTQVQLGKITARRSKPKRIPVFGIITGNGPESGMALWRYLNEEIRARLTCNQRMRGDLSYPKVIIQSIPEMGLSMELPEREEEIWCVVKDAIEQLIRCEVTHLAIACNTTHYYSDRIRHIYGTAIQFVSMVDVTSDHMRKVNAEDATIIGIPIVAGLGEHSAYKSLASLGVHPLDERYRPYIQEMAYLVKQWDARSPDTRSLNRLQHVMRSGISTSQVLVASTEVSVLLERFPRLRERIGGKIVVDSLRLYGQALAEIYLQSLPQEAAESLRVV